MKTAVDSKPSRGWSLAFRLTAYYALSAFLIVLLSTGYLYWAMVRNMDLEDDRLLADRIRLLHAQLLHQPLDVAAIQREVDEAWQSGQRTQVLIRILDVDGHVLCESKDMESQLPASAFPQPSEHLGTGRDLKPKSGPLHRILSVRLEGAAGKPASWVIQIGMDRSEEEELLDDYRENLLFVLTIALLVCTIIGFQITRRGLHPLFQITRVVSGTQPNNLSERIDATGMPREFRSLVETFNAMMDRLERAFHRLSSFTADIAHELRTPVNNMRGELDVALTKPRTAAEYEEVMGSSLEELGRLSRTIESLLFLARAENPQTQLQLEPIDVATELAGIFEFFAVTAEESSLMLQVDAEPNLPIAANRPLLQQALGNLITNAISHTPSGGSVRGRAIQSDSKIVVEIIDSGCGISPEHLPHLFNRFYRADSTPSALRPGLGIGLSLVKSIVDLHHGRIDISSKVGKGTTVRLTFPKYTSKMT